MNNTKNFTMRARLNREIDFTEDFRKKYMTREYGNYDKYEKNSVSTDYDDGGVEPSDYNKLYANYMNLIKRLPTEEAEDMKKQKATDLKGLLTDPARGHAEFGDMYFDWKVKEEESKAKNHELEVEYEFADNPLTKEKKWMGRMSPFAKE